MQVCLQFILVLSHLEFDVAYASALEARLVHAQTGWNIDWKLNQHANAKSFAYPKEDGKVPMGICDKAVSSLFHD